METTKTNTLEQLILNAFAKDCLDGLSADKKYLSSKYFYDHWGSKIFQDIMRMPEYYLTDCELEIFEKQKEDIYQAFSSHTSSFELVELGAGDGLKTKILLNHFLNKEIDFEYAPIDISESAVNQLLVDLEQEFPKLKTRGLIGDYFHLLEELNHQDLPKVLLFLGSNIGNFNRGKAVSFLSKLREQMKDHDQLFIGFDLKKDPQIILNAYSDPHGLTAAFNLNLLSRMNRELEANFDISAFKHLETYDEESGATKSFLISQKKQMVYLLKLEEQVSFEKGESIFMEISQKYDEAMINDLANSSGFKVSHSFYDSRHYYLNSLWELNE
ncbi:MULTISPECIES: L-histidine N(alpha)-methyltransferase [unclassified Lentimicrobium]|uniref:L-histidine N(alpha)-methyltransferase n=1 Tax=unclassified Lentimicrobium TaxID=2677434 RepID=UPI001552F99F|nr:MULTISPECIES: L-histidine N(alpha)-methyltransferase [unclassified Lentimicrobium]NPD44112.1 L-histidine N(alpha)-methyltransferase [Lentimicrobium sp. S6]NPD86669.1 L-histidine N(alpha)-methyltransferase [Lentimicrobium sp. L6]